MGSQVYKALRRGTTVVAVKRMNVDADEANDMLHQMRKETEILQRVANHPNVVQFYGTCSSNPPTICMEYMEVRPASFRRSMSTGCCLVGHTRENASLLCASWTWPQSWVPMAVAPVFSSTWVTYWH